MTKKDYELIAEVINDRFTNSTLLDVHGWSAKDIELGKAVLSDLAYFMNNRLAQENPRFDRTKFLQACGIETQAAYVNNKGNTVSYED